MLSLILSCQLKSDDTFTIKRSYISVFFNVSCFVYALLASKTDYTQIFTQYCAYNVLVSSLSTSANIIQNLFSLIKSQIALVLILVQLQFCSTFIIIICALSALLFYMNVRSGSKYQKQNVSMNFQKYSQRTENDLKLFLQTLLTPNLVKLIKQGKASMLKCEKDIVMLGVITVRAEMMSIEELAVKQKYLYQILDQGCQMYEINKIKSITGEYMFTSGFSQYFGTSFRNKNNVVGMCKLCTLAVETATLLDIQISSLIVLDEVLIGSNGVSTKAGHVDCFGLAIQKIKEELPQLKPGVYIDKPILDTNTLSMQAAKQQVFNNYYVDELDGYNKLTAKPFLLKNMEEQFTDVFNVSSYQEKQSYMAVNHRTSYDNNFSMKGSRLLSQEVSDNSNHSFEADHQNIHNLIEKSIFQIKLKQSWMTKIYNMFLIGFQMSDQFQAKNNDYIYQKYALIFMTWRALLFKLVLCLIVLITDIQLERENNAVSEILGMHFNSGDMQITSQVLLFCSILMSTIFSLIFYVVFNKQRVFDLQKVNKKTKGVHQLIAVAAQILQIFEIVVQYFQFISICIDYTKKSYDPIQKVAMQQIIVLKYIQVQIQTYLHISPFYNFLHSLSTSLKFALLALCSQTFIIFLFPKTLIYIFGLILSNFNVIFHQVQYFEKVLLEINSRYMLETKFQTNRKNIESVFDDISLAALRQQETYLINENDFKMELVDIDYSWCELMLQEKRMLYRLKTQGTNMSSKNLLARTQGSMSRAISRNNSFAFLQLDSQAKLHMAILNEFSREDSRYVNVKNMCKLGKCVIILLKAKNINQLTELQDVNICSYFDKFLELMHPVVKNDIETHIVRVTFDTASIIVLPNQDKTDIQKQLQKAFEIGLKLIEIITTANDQIQLGAGIGVSDVFIIQFGSYLYTFDYFGNGFQEAEKAANQCIHKSLCCKKNQFESYSSVYKQTSLTKIHYQLVKEWIMIQQTFQ
ncbi:Nucleotide_cyclase [Hexamita inflata]|uniref:Nucleotide cyclase n=1 Tax=Hexamita inflata TaxID=28002 RepID=A0AA86V753_9EUKA|nr:Nucleotide cyclase [Hexamita inflata]